MESLLSGAAVSATHIAVTAQIKNLLGSLMINAFPNGESRLTVLVRNGSERQARQTLATTKWPLAIDVEESPSRSEA